MSSNIPDEPIRHLVRRFFPGSTLRRTWELTGGVSAQVTALELQRPDGQTAKMIVRRHGDIDRQRNPHIARDEFTLLQFTRSRGLPVAEPYHVDESCELFPEPVLVMSYVDGETLFAPDDLADYLHQAAALLAKIHQVADPSELSFLPRRNIGFGERPAVLDVLLGEDRIWDALESAAPVISESEPVLLHGDFWPGNLLWSNGTLDAVIDWEDAAIGDALADLANARLEILWAFGMAAMNEFTETYFTASATLHRRSRLPYWDLCAALRPCGKLSSWGLADAAERRMRDAHARFVDQAVHRLSNEHEQSE